MIQLIVEDGGDRRGFKVGDGSLTVGSAPEAKLRLDAPDVAGIHAELEVVDGVATLHPRPGVLRPVIGGQPVEGPLVMGHDQPVVIGGARLTVRYPEGSPALERAQAPGAEPAARPEVRSPVRTKARTSPGGVRGASQRSRARRRKHTGSLLSLGILAGVIAVALGFVFFISPRFLGTTSAEFEPSARLGAAQRLIGVRQFDEALAELDAIPRNLMTEAVAARSDELRGEIARQRAELDANVQAALGDDWWREHLERFDKLFLRGTPKPGAVRFFLERLAQFEQRWPGHPRSDWVDRMQERYSQVANLEALPAIEDLEFKVWFYTTEDPRDWEQALTAIEDFVRRASGRGRDAAIDLREATVEARQAWFDETIQKAREEYTSGEAGGKSRSIAWLVRIVAYAGEADMADQAADQLLRFAGADDFDLQAELRGYRSKKPELFEPLSQHPKLAAYLAANPL